MINFIHIIAHLLEHYIQNIAIFGKVYKTAYLRYLGVKAVFQASFRAIRRCGKKRGANMEGKLYKIWWYSFSNSRDEERIPIISAKSIVTAAHFYDIMY